jgi:hypothetical protein
MQHAMHVVIDTVDGLCMLAISFCYHDCHRGNRLSLLLPPS